MNAMTILYEAHSGWRYLVILAAAVVIIKYLIGMFTRGEWSSLDQRLGMAFPIVLDIQFLLGLVLWIMQRRWMVPDALSSWEHPFTMLVVVAVAHVTWTRIKKAETADAKFRIGTIGFLIASVLLALGIARITHVI